MVSRYEWLTEPDSTVEPQQYATIISALGDWIEADLQWRAASKALATPSITWLESCEALEGILRKVDVQKDSAKRRAIEAGYVWRLDLDPWRGEG